MTAPGGFRVLLIGGTSNVGKSTVAAGLADRLGFACRSTDKLARHPGRPWQTAEREVPPHVAEHYRTLTVDELISSVLGHYARLWPRIEALVTGTETGLVLEGSALWPERVATLTAPDTAAVWLCADEALLCGRIRAAGHYAEATAAERHLLDQFLARTLRYQELMLAALDRLGLARVWVHAGQPPGEPADAILAAARSAARIDVDDGVVVEGGDIGVDGGGHQGAGGQRRGLAGGQ